MPTKKDPLKEILPTGMLLHHSIDLEAPIMVAVRKEAAARARARWLRRRGLLFLLLFLLLAFIALGYTQWGYTHPAYTSPWINCGFAGLCLLVVFVQLEVWWQRRAHAW